MIRSRPSELVLTLDDLEQASRRLLARKRAAAGQPTNRPDRSTLYDRAFGALDPTACLHRGPQRSRDEAISHVRGRIGDHKQQSAEYCSTDEDETGHAAFNRGQIPLVWPSFNTPTAYEEDDTQPSDTGFTHILDAYADSSPESNATQTPSSKMLNIFATTVGTGSTVNAKPRGRDDTSETGDTNTNMDYAVTPRQRRPITQDVPSPPKSEPTKPKRLSNHIWAAIKSRTMAHFSSTPDAQSDPPSSLPAMPANDDCQLITFPYEVWSSSSSQTAEDKRGTELPGTIMPSVPVLRPTHNQREILPGGPSTSAKEVMPIALASSQASSARDPDQAGHPRNTAALPSTPPNSMSDRFPRANRPPTTPSAIRMRVPRERLERLSRVPRPQHSDYENSDAALLATLQSDLADLSIGRSGEPAAQMDSTPPREGRYRRYRIPHSGRQT